MTSVFRRSGRVISSSASERESSPQLIPVRRETTSQQASSVRQSLSCARSATAARYSSREMRPSIYPSKASESRFEASGCSCRSRSRAQASSRISIALSGNRRSGIYLAASVTIRESSSSLTVMPWNRS